MKMRYRIGNRDSIANRVRIGSRLKTGYKGLVATALGFVLSGGLAEGAGLSFSNLPLKAITVTPEKSSGLEELYVVPTVQNVTMTYTAGSPTASVRWYRYSNLGGGYAEEIQGVAHSGNEWSITGFEGDMGYIVDEGTDRHCYWVVDYEEHPLGLGTLSVVPTEECDMVTLDLIGEADKIMYYTVNGRGVELDRELILSYYTMEYGEESGCFAEALREVKLASVAGEIHVPAPYCDTRFTLSGDRFARDWGVEQSVETSTYQTFAVNAHTEAVQEDRDNPNEQTDGGGGELGGSAPVNITFSAAVTPAAIFYEWQTSIDEEFNNIVNRYNELELDQTFTEMGRTYLRFVAADASGRCEYYGPVYTVQIGESRLDIPNAFSPNASEGTNDEWKVSYKSIVRFECHIFNRYGEKMITLTDPSQGWNGKYKGKFVPSGVYFYVIKAEGSDGVKYDKAGDINIIGYK